MICDVLPNSASPHLHSFKSKKYIHLIICTLHLEPRASRYFLTREMVIKKRPGPPSLTTERLPGRPPAFVSHINYVAGRSDALL